MVTYLALLRGINVGGKNRIKMKDLKACYRYDVIFLKAPLTADEAMDHVQVREDRGRDRGMEIGG